MSGSGPRSQTSVSRTRIFCALRLLLVCSESRSCCLCQAYLMHKGLRDTLHSFRFAMTCFAQGPHYSYKIACDRACSLLSTLFFQITFFHLITFDIAAFSFNKQRTVAHLADRSIDHDVTRRPPEWVVQHLHRRLRMASQLSIHCEWTQPSTTGSSKPILTSFVLTLSMVKSMQ